METQISLIGKSLEDLEIKIFHEGKDAVVHLADYRNKWLILFFYPADFTFVCPTELVEMAELYPEFQKLGCEVMSVSTDTVYVHKAWHDQSPSISKISFPMAADPMGALCKAMGTYITQGKDAGLSLRASFIIDPAGIIKAYEMHDNSIGRSAQELLRKLQAAIYVQEHGGEVCPASWRPGTQTLRPGMDLVGKI